MMMFDIIICLKDYLLIRLNKWLLKLLGNDLVVNYLFFWIFFNFILVFEY